MVAGVDGAVGPADATVTRPHVARRLVQPRHAHRADPGIAARRTWRLGAARLRRTGRRQVSLRSFPRQARRPRRHAGQRHRHARAPERPVVHDSRGLDAQHAWDARRAAFPPLPPCVCTTSRWSTTTATRAFGPTPRAFASTCCRPATAPGDLAGDLVAGATTRRALGTARDHADAARGPRVLLAGGAGVEQLQLDAPEGRIHSDVRFAFKGTDRFALTARADLKADQLAGWVQALDTARGELQVDISMPAAGGAPAFADITFVGPRFAWRGLEFEDLRGSGPLETRAITLKHLEVGTGAGPPRRRRPPGVDGRRRQPRDAARSRHRRRGDAADARFRRLQGHRPVRTACAGQRRVHRVLAWLAGRHARRHARHHVARAPRRLDAPERYGGHRSCAHAICARMPGPSTWTRASTTAST